MDTGGQADGGDVARSIGPSGRTSAYRVPDGEMSTGSTLSGYMAVAVLKGTGAIEKVYSVDMGATLFGPLVVHHWDAGTGMRLLPRPGTFTLHPAHQEHDFHLSNDVAVREDVFVLNGGPHQDGSVDPPAVYYTVQLRNDSARTVQIASYAFCDLRGRTPLDVVVTYDDDLGALIAWNDSQPDQARIFGCSRQPASYEALVDHAKAVAERCPGPLSGRTETVPSDPLGALELRHTLQPGERTHFYYLLSFSSAGRDGAAATYRACPGATAALQRTTAHYHDVLGRAVVLTPNAQVNHGVLWAKANMLRSELKPPTGWAFTNNPTESSHSVARDTSWFGYGGDYITPAFSRAALLAFVQRQEPSGMIVEYYDMRTGETNDLGLNINDDTPLLILALWHHYTVTGDEDFLREVYPCAVKAARHILSQRNEQGLVWCTATGTGGKGVIGWRNAMQNERLSGATTEVNSECVAALQRVSNMAQVLDKHDDGAEFARQAAELKEAINTHLYNPDNDLYYLNIEVDGLPRGTVTSDLVFPVMFDVASDETAARIINRLSARDFWTESGIRVLPRTALHYSADHESGLLGGVWVGVSFWFAFAAARFSPEFMDHALATSFRNYSRDPRKNNTVPGQFSEWLNGETLVNEGMMLSPWFPPRYLWAAIEGAAGLDLSAGPARVCPRLAPSWKWLAVRNLPYHGRHLSWLAVRMPDLEVYSTYPFAEMAPDRTYDEDITPRLHVHHDAAVPLGLRRGHDLLLFVGNTDRHTIAPALRVDGDLSGSYRQRSYDSLREGWRDEGRIAAETLTQGLIVEIERGGFHLLDLKRET